MPANSGQSPLLQVCTNFPLTKKNALSQGEGVAWVTEESVGDQAVRELPINRRTSPSTLSAPAPFSTSGTNATR